MLVILGFIMVSILLKKQNDILRLLIKKETPLDIKEKSDLNTVGGGDSLEC